MTNLVDLITPTNLESERDKFLSSSTYNPIFHYVWQDQQIVPEFTIKLKYPLWEAIKVQDHEAIVTAASELFEVEISEDALSRAMSTAKEEGKRSQGSAIEVATLFQKALDEFDLDYTIHVVPNPGFNVRPQHAQKAILISEHAHFEYISMEALVHHELVHLIRFRNGKYNRIRRSQNFLPTEEGLASWCQDVTNDDLSQVQHAMEYVAAAIGVEGSLRDVYDCMRDMGMSKSLAWKRASRHKFGFVDTSRPGDILKPAMYYANAEKVAKLATSERLRLFVGKIALQEFEQYPAYSGLWPGSHLSEYFLL